MMVVTAVVLRWLHVARARFEQGQSAEYDEAFHQYGTLDGDVCYEGKTGRPSTPTGYLYLFLQLEAVVKTNHKKCTAYGLKLIPQCAVCIGWHVVQFKTTIDSHHIRIMPYTLFCAIIGHKDKAPFSVKIDKTETVYELKTRIKAKNEHALASLNAYDLMLYKVDIDVSKKDTLAEVLLQISQGSITTNGELNPLSTISEYYEATPRGKRIHILIQLPRGELIDPRVRGAVAWTIADMTFVPKFMSPSNDSYCQSPHLQVSQSIQ